MPRTIKLKSTLASLISTNTSNRQILDNLREYVGQIEDGIAWPHNQMPATPTSITHYKKGASAPNLYTLVALADILNVSLDHLVFGEKEIVKDQRFDEGAISYLSQSIANNERRIERQFKSYMAISQFLSDKIQEAANTVPRNRPLGSRDIAEIMKIEACSQECLSAADNLYLDIILSQEITGHGVFFSTVVKNLKASRRYQFLLPESEESNQFIEKYEQMLDEQLPEGHGGCAFRTASAYSFPVTGFSLYRLNFPQIASEYGILYQEIIESVYEDKQDFWIGYLNPPNKLSQLYFSMDRTHVENALRYYRRLWEKPAKKRKAIGK